MHPDAHGRGAGEAPDLSGGISLKPRSGSVHISIAILNRIDTRPISATSALGPGALLTINQQRLLDRINPVMVLKFSDISFAQHLPAGYEQQTVGRINARGQNHSRLDF